MAMKIRPFVSFTKWPEELGSIGCVLIVCSISLAHLIPRCHFSKIGRLIFPVEVELFSVCYTADRNVLMYHTAKIVLLLHFPHICTTNQRWVIFEPESCEQALPLPPHKPANRNSSTMNSE